MLHFLVPNIRRQSGFSLIESLVAMVILATGMLGVAALYVESLRSGQTALARTKAITYAADMADRIRANRTGRGFYQVGPGDAGAQPTRCGADTGGAAADCTPQEMGAYDIWLWKTQIGNSTDAAARKLGLPSGTGEIDIDTTTQPNSFTIRITWADRSEDYVYTLSVVI